MSIREALPGKVDPAARNRCTSSGSSASRDIVDDTATFLEHRDYTAYGKLTRL